MNGIEGKEEEIKGKTRIRNLYKRQDKCHNVDAVRVVMEMNTRNGVGKSCRVQFFNKKINAIIKTHNNMLSA